MNSKIRISEREAYWCELLTSITDDVKIIDFIIDLDKRYEGMQTYLPDNDMPGHIISKLLNDNKKVHPTFLKKILIDKLKSMKFFYVGVKILDSNNQWNPIKETLFSFTVKNKGREIIFFEDKENADNVVKYFSKRCQ